MKYSAKIALLSVFLSLGFVSVAHADKKPRYLQDSAPAAGERVSGGDMKLRYNRYLTPYLPPDIRSVNEPVPVACDEQGRPSHDEHGRCRDYVSTSTGTRWRIRFETERGREGARILKLVGNQAILHAHFDTNQRPIFISPEASKLAQANPLPYEAQQDCTRLNVLEKISCELNNKAAVGVGVKVK